MARVMQQSVIGLVTGAYVTAFTPPAGTKGELLNVSAAQYSGIACQFQPSVLFGGVFWLDVGQFGVAAGVKSATQNWQSLMVTAAQSFGVGTIAGAPIAGFAIVTWMRVDL